MRSLFLALLAFALPPAHALEYQAEIGQCRFGLEKDGTFYQSDRYYRNYMTPSCAALGIADKFKDGPFGWRVAFVRTGYIEARDNITTAFDADAFQPNLVCNNSPNPPNGGRGCLANLNGNGNTWGFSFSATYEQRLGPLRAVIESGLFFFRHSFHNHPTQIDCTACRPLGDYDESSGPFTNPSPLLGLTLKAGFLYFAARHYWPAEHRALSLTDHSFTQLSTGLAFKY
ncbi:MAG TPA: hypothetical protein VM140_06220 [Burkholderiales bacterium]|nr:hypothetical protein [Burkholderiales bacterium]